MLRSSVYGPLLSTSIPSSFASCCTTYLTWPCITFGPLVRRGALCLVYIGTHLRQHPLISNILLRSTIIGTE